MPTSLAQFTADAKQARASRTARRASRRSTSPAPTGTSRWASSTTTAARSPTQMSGKWKGTLDSPKAIAGPDRVQDVLQRRLARQQDERRDPSEPVRRLRAGPRRLDRRPGWFSCCVGKKYTTVDDAVRDAEPHEGPGHAGLPRRLRPRGADRRTTRRSATDWIKDFTSTAARRPCRRRATSRTRPTCSASSVNERAAQRSWFVPTAKNWVNVENGNVLRTMLAQILTGKLVKQAAPVGEREHHAHAQPVTTHDGTRSRVDE